jgi:hypothetical protein
MKVLVGCEYSGTVRDAFIALGHDAMSCDLLPTDKPGPHFQGDVFEAIAMKDWDLAIFHPPCTYLCNSGVCWLHSDPDRWDKMREGATFFKALMDCNIPKICIENPIMHKYALEIIKRKQTQSIQPYEHGDPFSKRTCLWLKNLPIIVPTKILPLPESGRWSNQTPSGRCNLSPGPDRWKIRSTTYPGIAAAMAAQWGTEKQESQLKLF